MNVPVQNGSRASIRRHLRWGLFLVVLLVGGVGGWATMAEISGAVIASGSLVVDSNVKKVQHPTGGIVGEIRAYDGDQVKAGDILVRLDAVVTRSKLAIVNKNLTELTARKARLEAERDETEAITFPAYLLEQLDEPEVAHVVAGETKLFDLRRAARIGQKAQLRKRIAQRNEEITGFEAQVEAKTQEIVLVQRELAGKRLLWEKKLVLMGNLTELEREATRMKGEKAGLIATIARARGRIAETELQIIQINRDLGSEVAMELQQVEGKISEFLERKAVAEDELKRIDIRAPQDGTVHQSTVHTVGGVISAGEAIMLIVPKADNLMVEAKVAPQDIDQLYLGQPAKVSFSAFNQRTTPSINGTLIRISPDTTTDERSGQSNYTIRIAMPADEITRLGTVTLVSGMPVEVFIQTGERKVLTYLVQPLSDQITRAFREQ
mgnify:CR=1 FL=1|tara:strand:+ start:1160 stop:2470 length:1311 start_codon:yes stop_codon:yes gene_type:complete